MYFRADRAWVYSRVTFSLLERHKPQESDPRRVKELLVLDIDARPEHPLAPELNVVAPHDAERLRRRRRRQLALKLGQEARPLGLGWRRMLGEAAAQQWICQSAGLMEKRTNPRRHGLDDDLALFLLQ